MATTTVEVLAEAFKEAGTPFIVGHPGGESVELMEAARQREMRFLLMKQEVAGAMLAATWGDITGSPGICLSTRGPGAANMVNGVAHAFLDRSPLIAITDAYSRPTYETGLRQRLNQQALYAPMVKWSTIIDAKPCASSCGAPCAPRPARRRARCISNLPQSETTREAGAYAVRAAAAAESGSLPGPGAQRPQAGARHVRPRQATDLYRRPGRVLCGASAEFVKFAERLGAPVLTTTKCKGMIPEDHRLRAGCIIGGLIERKLVNEADLIITVGLDAVELQPKPWPYTLPVLALSSVPASMRWCRPIRRSSASSSALLAGWREWAPERHRTGARRRPKNFREEVSDALNTPSHRPFAATHRWKSPAPCCRATPSPPAMPAPAGCWWCRNGSPTGRARFLTSNGLASMGYAVPGALAARLAYPDRPVVAFTGDGGFLMAVAELQTAQREEPADHRGRVRRPPKSASFASSRRSRTFRSTA